MFVSWLNCCENSNPLFMITVYSYPLKSEIFQCCLSSYFWWQNVYNSSNNNNNNFTMTIIIIIIIIIIITFTIAITRIIIVVIIIITIINNCIAKMEVGCLKYPGASTIGSQPLDWNNAPMTGTTKQPSHEPPHQRKGTGTHHTDKSISGEKPNWPRGRVGEEENGRQKPSTKGKLNAPRNHMIDVASLRACAC